jgi:hypothetical protein
MIHLMIHTGVTGVSDAGKERKRSVPKHEHTPFCRDLQSFDFTGLFFLLQSGMLSHV